jgi:hypothetical protein
MHFWWADSGGAQLLALAAPMPSHTRCWFWWVDDQVKRFLVGVGRGVVRHCTDWQYM